MTSALGSRQSPSPPNKFDIVDGNPRQKLRFNAGDSSQSRKFGHATRCCCHAFWPLRWHEGHRISYRNLADVLWGDATGSVRELMGWVEKRYGDKWMIEDCKAKAFRILPKPKAPKGKANFRRRAMSPRVVAGERAKRPPGYTNRPVSWAMSRRLPGSSGIRRIRRRA